MRPATGETLWLLLPSVSVEWFALALAEFARAAGVGERKRVVLALDRAGWHASRRPAIPDGLHPAFLPAYSPELQPAERLWPLVDEPVANRAFRDLAELEGVLGDRCLTLEADPETIRGLTRYHWWPE